MALYRVVMDAKMASYKYPTEEDLKKIEDWELKSFSDLEEFLAFIKSIWWLPDWGWRQTQRRLYLSTGGWSGNESIISAMKKQFVFWMMHWRLERFGGHYEFEIKRSHWSN